VPVPVGNVLLAQEHVHRMGVRVGMVQDVEVRDVAEVEADVEAGNVESGDVVEDESYAK